MLRRALTCLAATALMATPGRPTLIRGARVVTLEGAALPKGDVLIQDGLILQVAASLSAPPDADILEAQGLTLYPGIFDAFNQLGLAEISAVSATLDHTELGDANPQLAAATALHPDSELLRAARAAGITHSLAVPGFTGSRRGFGGGGALMGGHATTFQLDGWTSENMRIQERSALVVNWPHLASRSLDPLSNAVKTRPLAEVKLDMEKRLGELETWFDRARQYVRSSASVARDLKLEGLGPIVKGERPVLVFASDERDIKAAVGFFEKQKIRMILVGGEDAIKVAPLLKEKQIPVILGPVLAMPEDEDDPYDEAYTLPSRLQAAGITLALGGGEASISRRLPQQAGMAVAYGLPYEEALKAITLNPARMLGLDRDYGTIRPGKVANLVLADGDLLEPRTIVKAVFIRGVAVDLTTRQTALYDRYKKRIP
jgi:imidazolonepropionase-like amidohydrolase